MPGGWLEKFGRGENRAVKRMDNAETDGGGRMVGQDGREIQAFTVLKSLKLLCAAMDTGL
jgi:hypothetical protein